MEPFIPGWKLDQRTAVQLTAAACGAGALAVLLRTVSRRRAARDKIQRARTRRTESLQRAEQEVQRYRQAHPSSTSALISSSSLLKLTDHLHKGSLTPEDVFYFYMEKTLAAHKKLNCCAEILPESFDQLKTLASNKDGLLYGVPVSIKENLEYKDHDTSCGVVVNLDRPAKRDSVIVEVLKRQGAVPFVKTNLPQALLSYDCSNPIYGQTLNPHHLQKTSGGSSGGEGALIGAGGSLLGIGSDIGGSIRIPASFCGICGFKPTAGRLSLQGLVPIYRGQKSVPSSPGPMARDVDSLALCMRALLCNHMFALDPTVPPLPFNDQIYQSSRPLTIGFLENDGFTEASPAMVRSVREVKALLEQAGHTLVPFCPPRISQVVPELMLKGVFADGTTSMLRKLEGGPIDPCLAPQIRLYSLPLWLKKTLSFLLKPFTPRLPAVLRALSGISCISDLWEHHAAVEDYISETIAAWRRSNLDVLLCPVLGPAFNFHYCGRFSGGISYTMIYNLLNFPAGVVPVSRVTAADEENLKHYKGNFQDYLDKLLPQAARGGQGLPVGVQCVALPWQDELCLRFMKEVEQLVAQSGK